MCTIAHYRPYVTFLHQKKSLTGTNATNAKHLDDASHLESPENVSNDLLFNEK